jgi:hypothetical protein
VKDYLMLEGVRYEIHAVWHRERTTADSWLVEMTVYKKEADAAT